VKIGDTIFFHNGGCLKKDKVRQMTSEIAKEISSKKMYTVFKLENLVRISLW